MLVLQTEKGFSGIGEALFVAQNNLRGTRLGPRTSRPLLPILQHGVSKSGRDVRGPSPCVSCKDMGTNEKGFSNTMEKPFVLG
ncbi:hypothetical protein [Labrys neptuniae]